MAIKRGVAVWMASFLTFLAASCSFASIFYWIHDGRDFPIKPYLIGQFIGELRVEECFWISITATFILLGLTFIIAYRKMPPDPETAKILVKIGRNLTALRESQQAVLTEVSGNLENIRETNERFSKKISENIENNRKETLDLFERQQRTIEKTSRNIDSTIGKKVTRFKEEMLSALEKHRTAILKVESLNKRGQLALKQQAAELKNLTNRLENVESRLLKPKPLLESHDNLEQVKGIGPRLGEELRSIGISNVGELIMANSTAIAEKTRISQEMAEQLQAKVQLLLVPGLSEADSELLLEAEIKSRGELAAQELIPLAKKIDTIAEIYIKEGKIPKKEKPTIEKISSWIRIAKS